MVATLYGQNSLVLLLGTGNTGFSAPLPLLTNGAGPYRLCTGDFNADGNPDFVLFSWITGNMSVRLGNGMGGFTTANIYPGGYIGELVPCDFKRWET
ncbi:MAG: VCBS repeat-containing protein [Chitinophagaceae bacterium]|nr:VCBS repeat-containing protein [Chitinophagaceae bacterium]